MNLLSIRKTLGRGRHKTLKLGNLLRDQKMRLGQVCLIHSARRIFCCARISPNLRVFCAPAARILMNNEKKIEKLCAQGEKKRA